jgi:hypothetical protein
MVEQVDNTYGYYLDKHCQCRGYMKPASTPYRRLQVFEIPEWAFTVDEHQLFAATCGHFSDIQKSELPDTDSSSRWDPICQHILQYRPVSFIKVSVKLNSNLNRILVYVSVGAQYHKPRAELAPCSRLLIMLSSNSYCPHPSFMPTKPGIAAVTKIAGCGRPAPIVYPTS